MKLKTIQPKFSVGQIVKVRAFTDCFGVFKPEKSGYRIVSITLIKPLVPNQPFNPYYRIFAIKENGDVIEGAEHFFLD